MLWSNSKILILFQVVSFLLIYFWIVVQRAYVYLGAYSDYSPAPTIKPIYSASAAHHYPMTPQHFQVDCPVKVGSKQQM